ncbi:uncharacterized protein LOC143024765 [Oratosquilla oratoria]|uniref:uncharacterized protein LOC143024765 n=1 Tax=Oratosquilla oratoria TaxID=337810 RepID=UPI003F773C22
MSVQFDASATKLVRPYRDPSTSIYIVVETTSNSEAPTLALGHLQGSGRQGCFQFHVYNTVNPTLLGLLVTIQAPNSDYFINNENSSTSTPSLLQSSQTPSSLQCIGSTFFLLSSAEGDMRVTIRNALTQQYLSASGSTLSFVTEPNEGSITDDLLFEILDCPHPDHGGIP